MIEDRAESEPKPTPGDREAEPGPEEEEDAEEEFVEEAVDAIEEYPDLPKVNKTVKIQDDDVAVCTPEDIEGTTVGIEVDTGV